ncbi:MAG: hypothetical protein ACRDRH_09030 [Pseudonocardia sp.]
MLATQHANPTDAYAGLPNDFVLTGPPTIELASGATITLRDWLMHYHPNGGRAWSALTDDFYRTAMNHRAVQHALAVLTRKDAQLYFLALQLAAINHDGITVGDMRCLQQQSEPAERPVATETYNGIIDALRAALARQGAPDPAIRNLINTMGPLRDAIARPQNPQRGRPARAVPHERP